MNTEFLILSSFVFLFTSCSSKKVLSPASCIEYIYAQDSQFGSVRNTDCQVASLSQSIHTYIKKVNELDFSSCPSNFSTAFNRHMDAWEKMTQITDQYPSLRGEMHDLFDQIKVKDNSGQFDILLKEIWDTWAVVETAGERI